MLLDYPWELFLILTQWGVSLQRWPVLLICLGLSQFYHSKCHVLGNSSVPVNQNNVSLHPCSIRAPPSGPDHPGDIHLSHSETFHFSVLGILLCFELRETHWYRSCLPHNYIKWSPLEQFKCDCTLKSPEACLFRAFLDSILYSSIFPVSHLKKNIYLILSIFFFFTIRGIINITQTQSILKKQTSEIAETNPFPEASIPGVYVPSRAVDWDLATS